MFDRCCAHLALAAVGPIFGACHTSIPESRLVQIDLPRLASPDLPEAQLAQLTAGNQAFAFDLYHAIATQSKENLILSPYSISLAFSMIDAGARGAADTEMAEVLHVLSQETHHLAPNAIEPNF